MVYKLTITRDESASMKGLLIGLVVLGHNCFFVPVFLQGTFEWLYCFHVSCFFILPFFYTEQNVSWARVQTNFKRLFWPYTWMFILLFLVNSVMLKSLKVDFGLFDTFLTGNFYRLKNYVGFQYLWFLPAMFSMMIIKDVFTSSNKALKRMLLIFGAILYIMFWIFLYNRPYAETINTSLSQISIFSFMLGFAMFFLGFCTKKLMDSFKIPSWILIVLMIFFLFTLVLTENTAYFNYIKWISRALCPLMGFALLFSNVHVYNCLILKRIGESSLLIYLFHQPINVAVCSLLRRFNIPTVVNLVVSYFIVIILAFLLSKIVVSIPKVKRVLLMK